jgi:hypothetical protein
VRTLSDTDLQERRAAAELAITVYGEGGSIDRA